MRRLEVLDTQYMQYAKTKSEKFTSIFENHKDCRWSYWKNMNAVDMLKHVTNTVFPFIQKLTDGEDVLYSKYMEGATFMIQKPSLLQETVSIFDELNITNQNQDTQGDIYEYLLSELKISGKNGQFRTPRHIIRMIIELVNPQLGETICDPACGTGGFLVNAYEHIVKNNTSVDLIQYDEDGSAHNLIGDKIVKKEHWNLLKAKSFYGFDFEYTMVRTGLMNMILHGIRHPNISYADSLSKRFDQTKQFDIILANPPFSGSIDKGDINDNFKLKTTQTELLFGELFYNILKTGGRAGVVLPNGVLYGPTNAHAILRKRLIDECQIEAIISLPSGVFKPYSGQSTSVIVFVKGGKTENVWFYKMDSDGYTLDDKRTIIDGKGDIPDIIKKFQSKSTSEKSFVVNVKEIRANKYNLFHTTYKKIKNKTTSYEKPDVILDKNIKLQKELLNYLENLKSKL